MSDSASSFLVMVPVLSEHKISMPAISSTAASLVMIAPSLARDIAPTAIVTERTAGRAAGIAATISTNAN